jgi:hypothetical protein
MKDINTIIGKPKEEAFLIIQENNMVSRIMEEDGVSKIGTFDFRSDRINLSLKNNIVIDFDFG